MSGRRDQSDSGHGRDGGYGSGDPSYPGGRGYSAASNPYEQVSVNPAHLAASLNGIDDYWQQPAPYSDHARQDDAMGDSVDSPIDAAALQFALPPNISQSVRSRVPSLGLQPLSSEAFPRTSSASSYYADQRLDRPFGGPLDDPFGGSFDDSLDGTMRHLDQHDAGNESDRVPLTTSAQPISGARAQLVVTPTEEYSRDSFQTVRDLDSSPSRSRDTRMLGFDLETGQSRGYGDSLSPSTNSRRSRSASTSASGALHRTASIMREVSQRVVDISGGGEALEEQARRSRSLSRSRNSSVDGRVSQHVAAVPMLVDTSYSAQAYGSPAEKSGVPGNMTPLPTPVSGHRTPMGNPLRGKSLGIFSADNPIRTAMLELLMQPWVESAILGLIIFQAVLLAVEAAPDVWSPGNARTDRWSSSWYNWSMLGLFIVFTAEIVVRVIVSGFIFNAPEYSTIDRKAGIRHGLRAAVTDQYRNFFQPQRQKSTRRPPTETFTPSPFARSFTFMHSQRAPESYDEHRRMQLARRAFLRHGFNRLDFVAVVSFWISFVLACTGIEYAHHIYLFRMLSCLRILRLLGITKGNAIILRSLKKASPLLVRVSFLIGFFWLLFAIIGVQSFKSSLSRQCVWLDPMQPTNLSASYTNSFQFCGGYLVNNTDVEPTTLPWVQMKEPNDLTILVNGSSSGKGFICPRGSICLQQTAPYNATVSFDDIFHSLELVFVIMSANTFSDLMYYTTDSDYLPAALFFAAGIVVMMLWMTNLLIAVITSSFLLIREENKGSAFTADEKNFTTAHVDEAPLRRWSLKWIYDKIAWFFVLMIALGLFAQAFRSAAHENRIPAINAIEIMVTSLLDVEIVLRIAQDWRRFPHAFRNIFDLGLAVITTVILIPEIRHREQLYAWLTVFQILRTYRLVLAIPMTRGLIKLVLGNSTGIANLVLFVFLITFLMAIFAVQLFRGEITPLDDDGNNIRITFGNIFNSFLGMYQLMSSENWTVILYTVTTFTTRLHNAWIGAIFLIGWFTLAYFILVNMFIAVIQENFDVSEDQKRLEQVKAFLQRKELGSSASNLSLSAMFSFGRRQKRKDPLDYGPAMMEMLLKEAVVHEFLNEASDSLESPDSPETHGHGHGHGHEEATVMQPGILSAVWSRMVRITTSREPNPFYSSIRLHAINEALDPRQMAREAVSATAARRKAQREYLTRHPSYNNSLFVFSPRNPIRRMCQSIVGPGRGSERFDGTDPHKYPWYIFSAFIYASIVAMVIIACITTPLYQKEYFDAGHTFSSKNWFVWTDLAFALVFSFEMLVKVIADGFLWTPNAFFRSTWGVIDAVVLITLWINVATLFANDGAVSRAVGAFKALRALRLLNISDSARETFHSLMIVGGWKILSAAFVSISLLIPFAVLGLNLFRGKMVTCNDGSLLQLVDCSGEFLSAPFSSDWQLLAPRVASNPYFSFDDFGASLVVLFEIVSQEGWVDVSFQAQAITGTGLQPQFGAAQGNAVFFIVFNLLATVFILTLFISVFMRNYTEQTGVAFLTGDQRSWLELRKLLRQISPSKSSYDDSKNRLKRWCHKRAIEKRGKWYLGITVVLVVHLILLVLEYAGEPMWWSNTRDYLFLALTLVYMVNIAIRIIGLGWSRVRRSSWDIFSMCSVSGAFITSVLFLSLHREDTLVQLHKIFLVAIVLMLIPRNDALDQLFKTAAASLSTIGSLVATWLVFFMVFAIAMTQSFSLTRFGSQESSNINLRTVPKALILLLRMSCGEGWNQLMEDYADIRPPLCVEADTFFESDCGSKAWARVLFIGWNIISMYIFVNLFVSLIYESFSYVYQRSSGLVDINRDEIRRFKEAWRSVDPNGTGFISRDAFPQLLAELSGVFEMRIYDHEDSVGSILEHVRNDDSRSLARHSSLAIPFSAPPTFTGVDLKKLNDRIGKIDVERVRSRRRRFNFFYEEVMVSADPDNGISFTTVLMIIAHYNIISDSKSLRLEEFLRRRARLQRVDEELRRRTVQGFFDTLYWSRRFRRHLEMKRASRMTTVPRLDIPDILVDADDDGHTNKVRQRQQTPTTPTAGPAPFFPSPPKPSSFLSADDARAASSHSNGQSQLHHRSWSGASMDISLHDTNYAHPLSLPWTSGVRASTSAMSSAISTGSGGTGGSGNFLHQSLSAQQHHHSSSAFSFDLQEPGSQPGSQPVSGASSRRGSAVSPAHVSAMLDDSVWMDSIRRSATHRRDGGWNKARKKDDVWITRGLLSALARGREASSCESSLQRQDGPPARLSTAKHGNRPQTLPHVPTLQQTPGSVWLHVLRPHGSRSPHQSVWVTGAGVSATPGPKQRPLARDRKTTVAYSSRHHHHRQAIMMQSSRFHAIAARFSPQGIRTSFRLRSASASSTSSTSSFGSATSSPVSTVNSVIVRQPSIVNMEEERRIFSSGLAVLEPRPIVYWGGMEERMGSF
ncbi:calcium channel subunit cch1 [Grosmannia clavigera kw1407]|uniref:Calcium-channel protein CCH1 n=1 Tax=Grosmannia clavigera (strain kw1407 / UAMH 11150) TaxID=655863 RepID=F0XMG8_GROCL|nr:calcium channel subunit cch1 [Grosmannia clavigera kw1407]EFX01203.1 calcium channel subunit cch1 [Grosmannia clavigera kw1407]